MMLHVSNSTRVIILILVASFALGIGPHKFCFNVLTPLISVLRRSRSNSKVSSSDPCLQSPNKPIGSC